MPGKNSNPNKFKARVFKALSDPVRLDILDFLRGGEKCVCEIIPRVGLIQPVVSRHLKILKDCGVIRYRKDGTRRLYSLTDEHVLRLIDDLTPELMDLLKRRMLELMT